MSEEQRRQDDSSWGAAEMPSLWRERRAPGPDTDLNRRDPRGSAGRGGSLSRSIDVGPSPGAGKPALLSPGFWWPMRGRWKWAGFASLIGLMLGAGLGYATSTVRYAVDGRVELRSMQTGGSDRPAPTADDVRGVVQREAVLLNESADAFTTDAMKVTVVPTPPTGLSVTLQASDRASAQAALTQTLATYEQQTTLHAETALAEQADRLSGELDQLRTTRDDLQRRIDALSWSDGVALVAALEAAQREAATITQRLERIGQWFDDSNRLKVSRDTALVVLAENDARTSELLIERAELLIDLIRALAERRRGAAAELKARWLAMAEEIDAIAADTRVLPAAWVGAPQDEQRLVAVRLSELRVQQAELETALIDSRQRVAALEETHRRVRELQDELRDARRRTQLAEESFAQLAERPAVVMKLVSTRVVTDSTTGPVVDNRVSRLALGAGLGGLLGLLTVLIAAFADPKLRRADPEPWAQREAPLVGVVPHVNTRAAPSSDPAQAAAIQRDLTRLADAVHAIRAVVEAQLDGQHAQTICVTSASPGSGKTSLTIGLASSLVMGGLRVLVVDAALSDRKRQGNAGVADSGLTHDAEPAGQTLEDALGAMGYLEPEDRDLLAFPDDQPVGLGAYVRGTPLASAVIHTRVAGLAILGAAHVKPGDAGRLSRTFLERMARDAGDDFDVVLFDTGTVPDAVEAVFIAGACRGVLLVVGRDEPRRRVDVALQKLRMVGARMLGTVFNRELQTARFREKFAAPAEGSPLLDPSWRNQGSGMFAAAVRTHGGQDGTVETPRSQTGLYRGQHPSQAQRDAEAAAQTTDAGPIDFANDAAPDFNPHEHPEQTHESFDYDFDNDGPADLSHETAIDFTASEPLDLATPSNQPGSIPPPVTTPTTAPGSDRQRDETAHDELIPHHDHDHDLARDDELIDQYIDSVLDAVGSDAAGRRRASARPAADPPPAEPR